jgi:hypothetical protein
LICAHEVAIFDSICSFCAMYMGNLDTLCNLSVSIFYLDRNLKYYPKYKILRIILLYLDRWVRKAH